MKTIMNSGTFFSVMNFLYLLRHSHIRALVPCPGLTSEVCVVASTSVPLTPTEILSEYFPRASGT